MRNYRSLRSLTFRTPVTCSCRDRKRRPFSSLFRQFLIDDLREARESRSAASTSLCRLRINNSGSCLIERFALRHKILDLCPPGFCNCQTLLNVGLRQEISLALNELIGVDSGNSIHGRDPPFRRAVLFEVDERIGRFPPAMTSPVNTIFPLGRWITGSPLVCARAQ
jgi:hypothetical protein